MQEFYTFQWPLQLQRIKFSSLSVIRTLICGKGVVLREPPHKSQPFLLAVEVPVEFKPRKSRARRKTTGGGGTSLAALGGRSEFNHKQDLHIEKIVKMKGNRRTKGRGGPLHKCLVIISGCPIYLTLTIPSCHREEENMFSLPKQGNG